MNFSFPQKLEHEEKFLQVSKRESFISFYKVAEGNVGWVVLGFG